MMPDMLFVSLMAGFMLLCLRLGKLLEEATK
jgi:hypothetical protein